MNAKDILRDTGHSYCGVPGCGKCHDNFRKLTRTERLLPGGVPRYIRCYDNGGESFDRYTVVFTGRYKHKTGGAFWYVGMSDNPFHPQGFGQHGESVGNQIDWPTYGHLGKKIQFQDLPEDCQKLVQDNYRYLWDLCAVCGASPAKYKGAFEERVYCKEHRPQEFYECGICGAYHRADWHGDCREDAERLYEIPNNAVLVDQEDLQP